MTINGQNTVATKKEKGKGILVLFPRFYENEYGD